MASNRQIEYITSLFTEIDKAVDSGALDPDTLGSIERLVRPIETHVALVLAERGDEINNRTASSIIDNLIKAKNLLPTIPLTSEQQNALAWATEHEGDGFLASLVAQYHAKRGLSPAQWHHLIKQFRQRAGAEGDDRVVVAKQGDGVARVDLSALLGDVADGFYALDSATGNNDTDFFAATTNQGRRNPANKGKRWLYRFIGGTGRVSLSDTERQSVGQRLAALTPEERVDAQRRFGQEVGSCGRCGRPLTDVTSRVTGLGPDCRAHVGYTPTEAELAEVQRLVEAAAKRGQQLPE